MGAVLRDWAGIVFASIFTTALLGPWPVISSVWWESCPRPPHSVQSSELVRAGLMVFSSTSKTLFTILSLWALVRMLFIAIIYMSSVM